MKNPLLLKIITIAFLIILLLLLVQKISNIINDRRALQENVVAEIAKSTSASQKLVGPVLVIPYVKRVKAWDTNPATNKSTEDYVEVPGQLYFLPEAFAVDGILTTEKRTRGIYQARLYRADNTISGHFAVPENYGIDDDITNYKFSAPFLAVGIKDVSGIENNLTIDIDKKTLHMATGSRVQMLGSGAHAVLSPIDYRAKSVLGFSLRLKLHGTESLSVTPIGRESTITLKSDWPHPSFIGSVLPSSHKISDKGFSAEWLTSYFSSNLAESFETCIKSNDCEVFNSRSFGVSLIEPVNHYVKSDRAIKYAILFIALTFAGFFLFEILKRLAIHPVQYGLVGLALAFFYLLLVSLAEHIAFAQAYLIASSACILLIGFYVSYVLRSAVRSLIFSALLTALYAMLYGLLSAEDYALLMGSLLLFGLLGVFMVLTRKLDWYSVGKADAESVGFVARKVAGDQPAI